ncbi:hypothetical protein GOODEAATRI_000135 [Goodea atripinnis]|uniref:Uncharacterized protein n=1 Tax=Goodea atripinnis TaxID=208336 RepID=A0ABV0N7Z4_9TELE
MEAPPPDNHGAPLEPVGFGLGKPTESLTDHSYLHEFQFSLNGTSTVLDSPGSTTAVDSTVSPEEEEECLVDSQPMCFNKNPFLVANRKGKGLPPGEQILSGPPVGYGRQGKLQPWLFSKARCLGVVWRQHAVSRHSLMKHNLLSCLSPSWLKSMRMSSVANSLLTLCPILNFAGFIHCLPSPPCLCLSSLPLLTYGPNLHDSSPSVPHLQPRAPSPCSPDDFQMNVKQAYKAFAAVPRSLAPVLNDDVFDDRTDGQEGGGEGLTSKVSPRPSLSSDRREYMSLAAVPRFSRTSVELQVSAASMAGAALVGVWAAVCLA